MKFTFHINSKNVSAVVTGICVVVLAYIPLEVPADHWTWMRWKTTAFACVGAAVLSLLYQALTQSREDAEREEREQKRDEAVDGLQKSVGQGSNSSKPATNALTRALPHGPGSFDSAEFFRVAFYSALQDVVANSFKTEAERARPNDKESFYVDLLAVGSMKMLYDQIWWPLYRSQLRAMLALNNERGILALDTFRVPYDEAAREFAVEYEARHISFDLWLSYLETNVLLKVHPSRMIEITLQGKDFLKYLLHCGRSESTKRL